MIRYINAIDYTSLQRGIIMDEREKGRTWIHLDIKLTVFNVSPTIAWYFFERYFDEILSIPWRYNVRTLTWFERNAYDTIVSRKKISWSFSWVFSSDREHATREAHLKRAVENTSALSTRVSMVSLKKTFTIQSHRYSKCSKTLKQCSSRWNSWEKYVIFIDVSNEH